MSRVLFVCLGNICRSPAAEGILRTMAARVGKKLDVDSAALGDWNTGLPPDARTQQAAISRGYDLSGICARQITLADFTNFDFILAMDNQNLRELQRLHTSGTAKVKLLMNFVPGHEGKDIPDPYFGSAKDFALVQELLELACETLITIV